MEMARLVLLVVATVTTGLVAGLFYGFAVAVMPGLRRADDRTVVEVMQRINVAILNGWFLAAYLGSPLCTAAALALSVTGADPGAALVPTAGALLCGLAALAVTARVNIPLNNALEQAGPAAGAGDPAAVRRAFEGPWVRANVWRAVLCTASTALLAWALAVR